MPKRSYSAAGSYRYGFNGKENDNDVKGLGNQQDYGMRIYDARVGRFLSVDPLHKSFPYFSPYQFAGNSPTANLDLDGGEPLAFTENYKYKKLFDLNSKERLRENNADSKLVDDPNLGYVDVKLVYDDIKKAHFFIHEDDQGNFYYLRNDNGSTDVLTLKGGTIKISGGSLHPYETQNQTQARLSSKLANGIGAVVVSGTAAPFLLSGELWAGMWAVWSNPYVQAFIAGDVGAAYAYEYRTVTAGPVIEEYLITTSTPPSTQNAKPDTRSLAIEAHSTLDPSAQKYKTTAVGIDAEGNLYLASSDKVVPKVQREWAAARGINVVSGNGHAEETLLSNPNIKHVDASRGICSDCESLIKSNNVSTNTPMTGKKSKNRK